MILSCEKADLLNAINIVQRAVPSKTSNTLLMGIFLNADDKNNQLKLTGNNLELGIECSIDANVKEKGQLVLEAKIFGDIIRKMPDATIEIKKVRDNLVIIECRNSYFEIIGIDSEDYPGIPEVMKEKTLKLSQATVKNMIKQTSFSVGTDENRPVLKGMNINLKDGTLVFVAIDGFRLALRKSSVDFDEENISVIVPGKTLNEVGRILEASDDDLFIHIDENKIMFDLGHTKIVSALIEGEFLKYENVIPKEFESQMKINTADFLTSIDRASVIVDRDGSHFPINLCLKGDRLVITSKTSLGNSREELEVEVKGNEIDVRFNPRYFIEALREIDEKEINVSFNSDVGPCVITSVDKDTFVYLLLPVRKN